MDSFGSNLDNVSSKQSEDSVKKNILCQNTLCLPGGPMTPYTPP